MNTFSPRKTFISHLGPHKGPESDVPSLSHVWTCQKTIYQNKRPVNVHLYPGKRTPVSLTKETILNETDLCRRESKIEYEKGVKNVSLHHIFKGNSVHK